MSTIQFFSKTCFHYFLKMQWVQQALKANYKSYLALIVSQICKQGIFCKDTVTR